MPVVRAAGPKNGVTPSLLPSATAPCLFCVRGFPKFIRFHFVTTVGNHMRNDSREEQR